MKKVTDRDKLKELRNKIYYYLMLAAIDVKNEDFSKFNWFIEKAKEGYKEYIELNTGSRIS